MKSRLLTVLAITALVVGLFGFATPVQAVAYGTSFVTSVTYMNYGSGEATLSFMFYAAGSSTGIPISRPNLGVNAASSLYVGGLTEIASGFQGSGMIVSSQPLGATLVQLPPGGSAVKNRPLSNGFSGGAAVVTIPTVLKNTFGSNSIFTIQNIAQAGADLTVEFIPVSGSPVVDTVTNLPSGAAKYYDMGTTPVIAAGSFNGSVRVTAKQTGTQIAGSIIGTSLELSTVNNNAYSFEGTMASGNTVYMPTAFCNWGAGVVNSAYAVQNVSTSSNASVTVTYAGGGVDGPHQVLPGAKLSFPGCGISGTVNTAGYIGSAVITSTGAPIVAMGKAFGGGYSTAFVGIIDGSEKVGLPYVRWTDSHWLDGTRQRVYIAIQNVGTVIAAGTLSVKFYDAAGTLVGTITNPSSIATGAKWSTSAQTINTDFGYVGTTGGGAIVQGPVSSKLAVIARAQTYLGPGIATAEDYNGISLP
ncbi:MAG TPA: hypothetical protein VN364_04700 [Bellilinea sp.]|nr:hypothetical protein [Bellilinea sp.]